MDSSAPCSALVPSQPSLAPSRASSGRYKFVGMLGRGGMAEVHDVVDLQTGKRIAQKRLFPQDEPEKQLKARQLFEREYQTLSQLSHPRIVEVYDFAIDDTGPYYTMELLSGGDLSQLVPMDYRRACRVVKDICSALSLLHSRSMVHRDLSPRNVRCTADGTAKLIDFGAMAPIGRNRSGIVGTPAYCAPEAINGQPLDARTDLYALGATLYYALTGRHAYPAKDFASLPERWQAACPAPSEYVAEIPPALDALVLELLRLDPLARPPSAFEVIARLCAIDGSSYDEQLVVAQAYLSTPTLVGRSAALSAVQRKIHRTDKGRGRGVVVSGPAGVGRSRFLDAVTLEVKLRGTIVVGADADDANEGDYGVVRALVRRLIAQIPERVYNAARDSAEVLAHAVPELGRIDGKASVPPDRAPVARPVVQQALRDWFVQLGQQASLVVTVDDVHAIDEPSAALLSLLAHDAKGARLLLVASLDPGATPTAPAAVKLLVDSAEAINLAPLLPDETEQLFRSIFGNGPNVGLLAHRLNSVAAGNPRDLMQLAQHLVDRNVIRYESGSWSVPGAFDGRDLPATMAQAFDARVAALSTEAREIACALSLAVGQTVAVEELQLLSGRADSAQAASSVDELFRAHVLRMSGDRAGLAQEGWARALQAKMSSRELQSLHLRLAKLFERRGNEVFRRGKHLLRGGETDLGVEVLARHAEQAREETGKSPDVFFKYMQSLPSDWFQVFQDALRVCDETNRPRKDNYAIRSRLSGMLWMSSESSVEQSVALVQELADYTGLTAFHEMDPSLEPAVRLKRALGIAAERHAALPEGDRLPELALTLRHLGRAISEVAGMITLALDLPSLKSVPSVLPFAAISPSFRVLQMLMDGMSRRFTGRFEEARAIYLELLERLAGADGGGIDPSHQEYTRNGVINGVAMMEAGIGLESALERSEYLAKNISTRVNAVQLRVVYQLWQGNAEEANRLRQQVELLQIQDSPRQLWEGTNLLWQVAAYGLSEDMTHLKQTVDELAGLTARYPRGWKPVHHYGLGEYHRAGGANEAALSEFRSGLALVDPGDHQMWPHLAGAHLRVLDELGRSKEAAALGEEYVKTADAAGLGYVTNYILMPLAVIQAKTGQKEAAVKTAERALASFAALNSTGLNVGLAHEARARVALLVGDKPEYSRHLAFCRDIYTTRGNAALVTKFEKLRRSAQQRKPAVVQPGGGGMGFFTTAATVGTSRLDLCQGPESRANCALSMVMDQCGATAGVLYLVGAHGPFAAASSGKADEVLGTLALEYLANEAGDLSTTGEGSSITTGESQADWTGAQGEKYRPVLLTHEGRDGFLITGVAVIATAPESPFTYPSRVANEVSRHLQRMGDVTGMVVAG